MVRRLAGCGALQPKEPSAHGRWSAFFSAVLRPCGFAVRESKRHQKRRLPTIAAARAPALPRLARGFHFIRGHVEDNHVQKPPRREGTRGDFPFCAGLRSCLPCAGRFFPVCPGSTRLGPARKRTQKRALKRGNIPNASLYGMNNVNHFAPVKPLDLSKCVTNAVNLLYIPSDNLRK